MHVLSLLEIGPTLLQPLLQFSKLLRVA